MDSIVYKGVILKVTLNKGFLNYEQYYIQVVTNIVLTKKTRRNIKMTTRMTFDIDEDLKTELQIIALKQKRTVKDVLNELVQDFVNENK